MTVVAWEQAVAGPIATRHLADLGARVIKIERPGEGDFARHYDSAVLGLASHFVWLNRGKESVVADLASPDGLSLVTRLIARSDVFLHNAGPGAAERLGLTAEALRKDHPGLVVVNISGFGSGGPMKNRKAYDLLVQAESGMVSVTGTPERAVKTGVPNADIGAGMYAAMAVLGALVRRARTGEGAIIDVSLFDAATEWMGHPLYMQLYAGTQVPRMGLSHASIAPYDAFPTEDGEILIGVQNNRGWKSLVQVLGVSEAAADEAFLTNESRIANRAACDALVARHTQRRTTADLLARLTEAGVPAAQIRTTAEVVEHPQLVERGRWRTVGTEAGEVAALLPPMTFQDVELAMGPVPALGEHTASIAAELSLAGEDHQVSSLRRSDLESEDERQPRCAKS